MKKIIYQLFEQIADAFSQNEDAILSLIFIKIPIAYIILHFLIKFW
jgi:hypothetical protein